jgi:hypothetical protein
LSPAWHPEAEAAIGPHPPPVGITPDLLTSSSCSSPSFAWQCMPRNFKLGVSVCQTSPFTRSLIFATRRNAARQKSLDTGLGSRLPKSMHGGR